MKFVSMPVKKIQIFGFGFNFHGEANYINEKKNKKSIGKQSLKSHRRQIFAHMRAASFLK